jgi:hypothetical protein
MENFDDTWHPERHCFHGGPRRIRQFHSDREGHFRSFRPSWKRGFRNREWEQRKASLYAVEQSLSCIRRDSIARDADTAFDAGCRDNSFSREFPAEVMNTVVVAGDLDVRLTVPMAEA